MVVVIEPAVAGAVPGRIDAAKRIVPTRDVVGVGIGNYEQVSLIIVGVARSLLDGCAVGFGGGEERAAVAILVAVFNVFWIGF